MAIVIPAFDPTAFKLAYPQYADITDDELDMLWEQVYPMAMPIIGLLKAGLQARYWNLAEAHAAEIWASGGLNGRVSDATEGSVKATLLYGVDDINAEPQKFWNKTAYGQQVYQIMTLRNMMKGGARYIPAFVCGGW